MLLLQRLTPVLVCFLLLILRGMSADMKGCQKALQEFFRATSSSLASFKNDEFGSPLLDYYFLPDSNLIQELAHIYFNPVTGADWYTNVIFTNPVKFQTDGPDFHSVEIEVQWPYNQGRRDGSVKFVCKGNDCSDSLFRLKEHLVNFNELICLKQRPNDGDDHFIKLTDNHKIKATIFGQTFDIFNTDLILLHLIRMPITKENPLFKTTRILLDEDKKMAIFGDVLGKVVAQVPLPQRISSEALQYIEGAILVVNRENRKSGFIDKAFSHRLKAIKQRKLEQTNKDG